MAFGEFIEPFTVQADIDQLIQDVQRFTGSRFRAAYSAQSLLGRNRIFDRIVARSQQVDLPCEDQCSPLYYFDLVRALRDFAGQYDQVIEVGTFLGGSTAFLAGCIEPFDFDLDLVDIYPPYLRFAYERVRRLYPEAAKRIRLFHGDLASYVQNVMLPGSSTRSIVHHDAAHEFSRVVKDLASLSFVQEDLVAIIAQDTNLRGAPRYMNFVDLALQAVFGSGMSFAPIGPVHPHSSAPDQYFGNYVTGGLPEGMVLPMEANRFVYPHPTHQIADFMATNAEIASTLAQLDEPVWSNEASAGQSADPILARSSH